MAKFLILILSFNIWAFEVDGLNSKKDKYIIRDYLKQQKKFFKEHCSVKKERTFEKLYKDFRSDGHYIPIVNKTGKLDRLAIKANLDLFDKKNKFIDSIISKLKKEKNFKAYKKRITQLEKNIDQVLWLKGEIDRGKQKYVVKFRAKIKKLFSQVQFLFNSLYFLHSFEFPVNHFELRRLYDQYKDDKRTYYNKLSNRIYFKRKIIEDGAHNTDLTKNDRRLRALMSSLYLTSIKKKKYFSEDFRFDLEKFLSQLKTHLTYGRAGLLIRTTSWKERNLRAMEFYKNLVAKGSEKKSGELVLKEISARNRLQEFVLNEQRGVYNFWMKKSDLYKTLFVMDTILYNEVGTFDGKYSFERSDVSRVIKHRLELPRYNRPNADDPLFKGIAKQSNILNTMFKRGEFSFTYFFIKENLRVFCPDMSRRGRLLRRNNLHISIDVLREKNDVSKATRYFSRAAMLGHIDMARLWKKYKRVPEQKGFLIKSQKYLMKKFRRKEYRYLYQFTDPEGEKFEVLDFGNKNYILSLKSNKFYTWRNPHYFRYFSK